MSIRDGARAHHHDPLALPDVSRDRHHGSTTLV